MANFTRFVDFQKALDKVWRTDLLYKLLKFSIRGKFYDMIKNIYSKTYSYIKSNGSFSAIFETNTGVKQRDPLSPLLFNIYLNDLVEYLGVNSMTPTLNEVKINSLLYADDLALVATSPEDLQVKLNLLHEYCKKWKLNINLSKTKIVEFNKTGKLNHKLNFTSGENNIKVENKYDYLGITLQSSLSFTNAKETIYKKRIKSMF